MNVYYFQHLFCIIFRWKCFKFDIKLPKQIQQGVLANKDLNSSFETMLHCRLAVPRGSRNLVWKGHMGPLGRSTQWDPETKLVRYYVNDKINVLWVCCLRKGHAIPCTKAAPDHSRVDRDNVVTSSVSWLVTWCVTLGDLRARQPADQRNACLRGRPGAVARSARRGRASSSGTDVTVWCLTTDGDDDPRLTSLLTVKRRVNKSENQREEESSSRKMSAIRAFVALS